MADEMREKNTILCAIICITLIICGVLFWPTLYRYDKIEKLPVRVNRITGYTEILYPRGWKPVSNAQAIPQNERDKVTIFGNFNSNENRYKGEVYNGTDYTLKKIRLSIGAKRDSGKIEWQKRYETPVDIAPYSKGSFSIGLIDNTTFFDLFADVPKVGEPAKKPAENPPVVQHFHAEVKIEEVFGYKGD